MSKAANTTAISSFNSNHSEYDVFRPSFSPILVNPFLAHLGLATKEVEGYSFDTSKVVLEIASGTGKFTQNLVDNGWQDNLIVLEPSKGMMETFSKKFPQIKQQILGSSYDIPLGDNSVDAVIIAQGFHWFSDTESLKEIQRVLKPQGKLGLIWNFDYTSPSHDSEIGQTEYYNAGSQYFQGLDFASAGTNREVFEQFFNKQPWNKAVTQYIYDFDVKVPQYRHGMWREVLQYNEYFGPKELNLFSFYDQHVSKSDVWKYWETRSYITDLSGEEKRKVKEHVEQLISEKVTDASYADKSKESLIKPMATHAVVVQSTKKWGVP
ncbi:putative methyltransferase-like C25B8.10 [Candida viswanathii]|uniref:Putative methyltransferase-like C25B8.10 n=1 Tax=Candida viswanathii TaxID=5486 RepID=A0A367XRX8_9ASCO|nr:putative methyltransferase-like C25B8.10 [Candida viswanathii]